MTHPDNHPFAQNRVKSIDVLRAVTMFLMIFVNDMTSISGVPEWLKHTAAEEDGMGFSDVIFPLFLFIVGLSIPLAVQVRFQKGERTLKVALHIIIRAVILIIMGLFMVNIPYINAEATGMSKNLWQFLMASGILLAWIDYKRLPELKKGMIITLKTLGLVLLLCLALIYRGGESENPVGMQVHWWGILGLIGWAYVLNSLLYLGSRSFKALLLPVFLLFAFMNIQENNLFESLPQIKIVISASNYLLVLGGVLCTVLLRRLKDQKWKFTTIIAAWALTLVTYGFLLRPLFPISKILASPSWTAICLGIGLWCLLLLFWIVDQGGNIRWATPIKAAGTSTLTCYLLPFLIYPLITWSGIVLPYWLRSGIPGLLKSLLFSFAVIQIARILEKQGIRLKV